MRTLPKFLLAVLLLTVASVGWAACPEGTTQTYKGCESEEGVVSSSSPTGYCYRTDNQYFYKPVSGNCSSSDRNITKQEFDNRRLSSSTTASSTQVTLRVTASHSGATIQIDGKYSGTTPTTIKVDKGSHTVKISKAGYTDYVRTINVRTNRSISAILKRKSSSTTASSGSTHDVVSCRSNTGKTSTVTRGFCDSQGWQVVRVIRQGNQTTVADKSSRTGYCYRTDNQYFYKPVSGNCSSSDRNITKQEYNNRRLSSSTTASSSSSTTSSTQVTLRVTASHSGATIQIDGKYSGTTPTTIKVDKGSHTVKISKAGYTDYVRTINVTANRSINAWLVWKPSSTTASSGSGSGNVVWCLSKSSYSGKFVNYVSKVQCTRLMGAAFSSQSLAEAQHQRQKSAEIILMPVVSTHVNLRVTSNYSGAEIRIDGKPSGVTPNIVKVNKGSHTVKITKVGYEDYVTTVNVTSNRTVRANLNRITTSTTASSSSTKIIWCATQLGSYQIRKDFCSARGGEWFPDEKSAEAKHARLRIVWCATKLSVSQVSKDSCSARGGEFFVFRFSAEEAHERLRTESTTEVASSSTSSTPEPTQTADTSLELQFWRDVTDSDDPDMFRAYLQKYPEGEFVLLAKINLKRLGGTTETIDSGIPDLNYGDYHALVIGNNDYESLPDLKTAVNDAQGIASLLEYDYGFEVSLLKNATRGDIVKALAGLRKTVGSEDNLLIYYAGHGYLDEAADEGYWLPVDADREDPSNWLATDRVVAQVRAMEAKHVMVVADSCFSGTIIRALKIEQRTPDYLQRIVKKKSRTALTSGGLEPVMDSGGGGKYSVFARSLISLLEENTGVLDASQLFSQLRPKVMVNSPQTPEYGDIHQAGHDGGDFLFVRQ